MQRTALWRRSSAGRGPTSPASSFRSWRPPFRGTATPTWAHGRRLPCGPTSQRHELGWVPTESLLSQWNNPNPLSLGFRCYSTIHLWDSTYDFNIIRKVKGTWGYISKRWQIYLTKQRFKYVAIWLQQPKTRLHMLQSSEVCRSAPDPEMSPQVQRFGHHQYGAGGLTFWWMTIQSLLSCLVMDQIHVG